MNCDLSEQSTKNRLLDIRGLQASYGPVEVLHGIDIHVNQGEIVTLLGCNGAGKSTTLMCASGIHSSMSGTIDLDGVDVSSIPAHERVASGLCQVPEGRRIFPRLTVRDNLLLGAFLRRDQTALLGDEEEMYILFPLLKQRRSQLGGTLSGGEQQMLAIARALMGKPRMLLLDEPSMGIAPMLVAKIFETLKILNERGMTILLVEQNANAALKLSHRAYVLETGRIILSGDSKDLLQDDRVRDAYLGA